MIGTYLELDGIWISDLNLAARYQIFVSHTSRVSGKL